MPGGIATRRSTGATASGGEYSTEEYAGSRTIALTELTSRLGPYTMARFLAFMRFVSAHMDTFASRSSRYTSSDACGSGICLNAASTATSFSQPIIVSTGMVVSTDEGSSRNHTLMSCATLCMSTSKSAPPTVLRLPTELASLTSLALRPCWPLYSPQLKAS